MVFTMYFALAMGLPKYTFLNFIIYNSESKQQKLHYIMLNIFNFI